MFGRVLATSQTIKHPRGSDKGFAGPEFEQLVASLGGTLLCPDRKNEPRRFGSLGGIRQWIESTFDTLKDELSSSSREPCGKVRARERLRAASLSAT